MAKPLQTLLIVRHDRSAILIWPVCGTGFGDEESKSPSLHPHAGRRCEKNLLLVQCGEGQPELERVLEGYRHATNTGRGCSRRKELNWGLDTDLAASGGARRRSGATGDKSRHRCGRGSLTGIQLGSSQGRLRGADGICRIIKKEVVLAGCAIRGRSSARAFLRGACDCAVDAESLSEPEDSQQHHEHQRQDGGGFRDLGAADFGAQPMQR